MISQEDKQWFRDFFTAMMVPQFLEIKRTIQQMSDKIKFDNPTELILGYQADFDEYTKQINQELKILKLRRSR